ncbi:hypothetical protein NQZ68_007146 [Dissostichus eleginoides]|nr:hypothetical protein NQZ68_007146 [Dissostichus eleginoides]
MPSYAIMKKQVDAFDSQRSYPAAIIRVSLSQTSGFSLMIWNTARRSDWYMLIVCTSLEFELHLVGAALGKRRFTTSSRRWVRLVDLLKNANDRDLGFVCDIRCLIYFNSNKWGCINLMPDIIFNDITDCFYEIILYPI